MLALFHTCPPEFMARIKSVKAECTSELVQPHMAVPGSPGRILAYGEPPAWASDYALVTGETTDAGLKAALLHVLEIEDHPKGRGMADWLSTVMGSEVVEVTEGWEKEDVRELEDN